MMIGSSVLGKLNGIYFLITAGHVITNFLSEDPCILAPDKGRFLRISELKTKISPDHLDLCIVELTSTHLEETLKWRQFIDLAGLNRTPKSSDITVGSTIGFTGYPSSKNSLPNPLDYTSVIAKPKGYLITCEHCDPSRPSYCEQDPTVHVVSNFSRRKYQKLDGSNVQAPKPYGMSGGGAWLLCGDDRANKTIEHYHLIGIGTEYDRHGPSLIATRIEHIFLALRTHWSNAVLA